MLGVRLASSGLVAVLCAALGVVFSPAVAHTQLRVDLTPFVGSYYALSKLGATGAAEERQENQPAIGGALLVRLSPTLGIEGSLALTPSGVNVTGASNAGFSGSIMFASARARFAVPRTNFYAIGGVGLVKRSGEAWDAPQFTSLSGVGGVLGFGTRAEVSRAVRIDVHAELQLYSLDPDGDGTAYDSKMQQDLIIALGIPLKLK
jgi:hypothetical protein